MFDQNKRILCIITIVFACSPYLDNNIQNFQLHNFIRCRGLGQLTSRMATNKIYVFISLYIIPQCRNNNYAFYILFHFSSLIFISPISYFPLSVCALFFISLVHDDDQFSQYLQRPSASSSREYFILFPPGGARPMFSAVQCAPPNLYFTLFRSVLMFISLQFTSRSAGIQIPHWYHWKA